MTAQPPAASNSAVVKELKRKAFVDPIKYDDINSPPDDIKKHKPVPLDEACAAIFTEATRKSIDLISKHYIRRNAHEAAKKAELDAAKISQLQADKKRLEQHLSNLAARVNAAVGEIRDLTAAKQTQQAVIDRLNLTIVNMTKRPWEEPPPYSRF